MTQEEFEKLQATFPWTEHTIQMSMGAVIQMIDCNGKEVSIFAMTGFLEMITRKLTKKSEQAAA